MASGLTEAEACQMEIELIAKYDTTNPNKGYNQTTGGELSFKMTDEARQKMKENHYDCSGENGSFYGKHHTQEAKDKISKANKGRFVGDKSPRYGISPSEDTREKMRVAAIGRKPSDLTKKKMSAQRTGFKNGAAKRPVYCIELNEIFWGATEVRNKYGINDNLVRFAMNGKRSYAGKHPITEEKLHWLYTEDAILQGYIAQKDLDDYLNNLMKGND